MGWESTERDRAKPYFMLLLLGNGGCRAFDSSDWERAERYFMELYLGIVVSRGREGSERDISEQ